MTRPTTRHTTRLTTRQARTYMVGQLGLRVKAKHCGLLGVRETLTRLRMIQLDPLDRVGTNADLVAMARVDGLKRGDVYDALLPGHAFEHYAKELCLLPATAFPFYRRQAQLTPWWRTPDRYREIPAEVVNEVFEEVLQRGATSTRELTDHGTVVPPDYGGWKVTGKLGTMVLRLLWLQCQLVVAGRRGKDKMYDTPARALAEWGRVAEEEKPPGPDGQEFARWALLERVEAAGLLTVNAGPQWGMLRETRKSALVEQCVADGLVERVTIEGSKRQYLAPGGFQGRTFPRDDREMRILGPLDPLVWDRKLVAHIFGFEYLWEVYKPAAQRRWGYYVCPLLHRGELVARFEGRVTDGELVVDTVWKEAPNRFDEAAWQACVERHQTQIT